MKGRYKEFAVLVVGLLLVFCGNVQPQTLRFAENLRHEEVLLPHSAPDREQLAPISLLTVVDDSQFVVVLALYDDPGTARAIDYLEVYDPSGELLIISWFDRYGIARLAMDRALLQDEPADLEHVLVLVEDGTSL
jgi:hypothetical protein